MPSPSAREAEALGGGRLQADPLRARGRGRRQASRHHGLAGGGRSLRLLADQRHIDVRRGVRRALALATGKRVGHEARRICIRAKFPPTAGSGLPMSPAASAPSSASTMAWSTTSPSEWLTTPFSCGTATPAPASDGRRGRSGGRRSPCRRASRVRRQRPPRARPSCAARMRSARAKSRSVVIFRLSSSPAVSATVQPGLLGHRGVVGQRAAGRGAGEPRGWPGSGTPAGSGHARGPSRGTCARDHGARPVPPT